VGGTLAGALSDIHIRNAEKANGAGQDGKKEAGYVGRRVQIIMVGAVVTVAALAMSEGGLRSVQPHQCVINTLQTEIPWQDWQTGKSRG
jgi:hypothetical protein